jgi:hypothetical protein
MFGGERLFKVFQFVVFITDFDVARAIEAWWDSVVNLQSKRKYLE